MSSLNKIQFLDVAETYVTGVPLVCKFILSSTHSPHPADRLGLFRVGWTSLQDHLCSRAISLTAGEGGGLNNNAAHFVTFNG